jgi:GTP-binding protein EngB required for normal cell division
MESADDRSGPKASVGERQDEPETPLRAYVQAKQSVAQLLRELQEFAGRSAPWAAERVHDLMVRLGEDRFQLVVVGQFKRGKSSLMNAILGRALLPTGTIPVTSAITSLRYGSFLRAVIKRADRALGQEILIAELPDFITERGNPDNQKHVLSAAIEVPAPFLRRGLHFVDTPGIGSAHEHNTATTLAFLPEADAAIFVTGADGPLSDNELQFLDAVRQHVRKLFFVLNKIDQLGPGEREEAIAYTTDLLAKRLGTDTIRLFPLSAAQALAAKQGDAEARAASGLLALESALATFLNDERRTVFLVAVLDRAIGALEEARFMLGLQQRAAEQTSTSSGPTIAELDHALDALELERDTVISRATQRIAEWQTSVLDPSIERFATEALAVGSRDLAVAVEDMSSIARDYYSRVDDRMRTQLQERAAQWLRDLVSPVDVFARHIANDAHSEIATVIDKPRSVVASLLGPKGGGVGSLETYARWEWMAPPFEPSPDGLAVGFGASGGEPPHAPLPHALAVRVAVRRLARRLPAYIKQTADALRDVILGHLQGCVADMDRLSERRLADERRRVELVVKPEKLAAKSVQGPRATVTGDPAAELQALLARIIALRNALLQREPLPQSALASASTEAASHAEPAETDAEPRSQPKGTRTVTGTCAICAVASDAVFDFLCQYQYGIGHDRTAQRQFLASHGLCPTHTWHLERISSPRGISLGYPSLLDQMEERVRGMANLPLAGAIQRLEELASHADTCPACGARQRAEQRAAEHLSGALRTPEGLAAFQQSQWLCLTHLRLLLTGVDDDIAAALFRLQARRLTDLAESMREFVIKQDALRRSLLTEEEVRAYRQALVLLVGEKYLFRTESEE